MESIADLYQAAVQINMHGSHEEKRVFLSGFLTAIAKYVEESDDEITDTLMLTIIMSIGKSIALGSLGTEEVAE